MSENLPQTTADCSRTGAGPTLGIATASLAALPSLAERIAWAREHGFDGIEIAATGRPRDLYAPSVTKTERIRLCDALNGFGAVVVEAPHQATLDVTLVSPSSAIRRASVAEIWSCLRVIDALGGGVVLVQTGRAPAGVHGDRQRDFVAECLTTLDRMAGDHNARIGILTTDYFRRGERLDLLDLLRLRHTGVALDTAELVDDTFPAAVAAASVAGDGLADLVRRLGPRLIHLRLGGDLPVSEDTATAGLAAALQSTRYAAMTCLAFDPDAVSPEQI